MNPYHMNTRNGLQFIHTCSNTYTLSEMISVGVLQLVKGVERLLKAILQRAKH